MIEGSDTASSFGATTIDVTSKTENNNDVHGIKQFGAQTDYADLIINAQSDGADIFGISLVGHDGAGIVEVAGDLNIKANGNGRYVNGVEVSALGKLSVSGKTDIDLSSDNDQASMYGVMPRLAVNWILQTMCRSR